MKTLSFLLLWLSLSPINAEAQSDCPDIYLDQNDPAIQDIPVWNQGIAPACYIYSSSFMATAWARKHWPVEKNFIVKPLEAFNELMSESDNVKEPILDAENGRTCMSLRWLLNGIAANLKNSSKLIQPECKMFGFNKVQNHQVLKEPIEFKNRMQELLEKNEFFSIEYCSGILQDSEEEFIKNRIFRSTLTYLNTQEQYRNFKSDCGFHVSVVVGQAMRDGKCQIRIRNSWGISNGENGYNWVDIDKLSKNVLRVVTFD